MGSSGRTPWSVLALALAALATALVAVAQAAKDDTILVSRASGPAGAGGDDLSRDPAISAGGDFVAFRSEANNLSAEDNNDFRNVFVRDTQTNTTTLVSRATGPAGAGGDGHSEVPSISGDGRLVAFASDADNLSTEDNNAVTNVFVRDLQANTTTLVSRATGVAGTGGDGLSRDPSTSADGRFVTFRSVANNLSADDTDATTDVFVRDLQANTTTLVSRATGVAGAGGNGVSTAPSISGDGRVVAFRSEADNLSTEDNDAEANIFVRDLQANTTTLVSRASGPAGAAADLASGFSGGPSISGDGRLVAFDSGATNLSTEDGISSDIFVRDLQANTTTLVSRATGVAGAGGDNASGGASISADGRFVAFESQADNLSTEDDDAVTDVFVRDLQANTTTLASRASSPAGVGGDGASDQPSTSTDGRFVAFRSDADNLSAEDNNAFTNVFLRDVLGPPPGPPVPGPAPTAPATGAPASDRRAPKLTLGGATRQPILRQRGAIFVTAMCDESCVVAASAGVSVPRASKLFRVRQVRRSIPAARRTKLRLKLSKKALRAVKRALRKRKRVSARVRVKATDVAGNASNATRKVRLVR